MKQAILPGRVLSLTVSLAWIAGMVMLHTGFHPYKGFLIWLAAILVIMVMAGLMPGMLNFCRFIAVVDFVLCIVYFIFAPHFGFLFLHLTDAIISLGAEKVHS